ncbi:uncharacterized protein N7482_010578 [Penicillium canariense]|uniref:Uncharacterized protein n=1 Tax=Penicillium canariense TaxID=189055 RepID=A0A9W9LD30_9EURO|nr:uncharacterized protein N7482_010578 [Penicillium canariense]KAJ5151326.1 hypothetical protein N7482_010578 [Penicillium canariense]
MDSKPVEQSRASFQAERQSWARADITSRHHPRYCRKENALVPLHPAGGSGENLTKQGRKRASEGWDLDAESALLVELIQLYHPTTRPGTARGVGNCEDAAPPGRKEARVM